ncbi:G-type lectin S-receptor-like serine/threonine-protein kinase LECRK3 isoform X1 [Actinidia eriantha]|uniref:G-type lectin S-receptor-like serine/threonine-protein kinase LECRK3 isoform X1 n=1 Tax=Actinidia eriantha TaxID=165200 RepID=UPI00258854F8|nr:G-type lectin S-receptor-like serine/threonine-protein kinase LECRK3 isoform X1 [Actinidia eriantha]XP_057484155.1 G-type lectin S-receptor-like serine/threonine-protein kinase LECRK3 isoform X1 [Actinidia eriantha]
MFYKYLFLKLQGSDIIRDGSRNLLWGPAIAQTYSNITLGSSLTANGKNSSWVSPSGDFAFGFQQIGTGGYLLAIWFNNIPEKTIVWSANGDSLAQEGSKIELKTDGSFVLSDPKGQQMWDPSLLGTRVAYAAMLDNGNFVLASNSSSLILWQSFDHPTDTILPTQVMNQGTTLNAHYTETNYSRGRFMFTLQNDGNLVLYTTKFPLDSVNFAYTASMTIGTGFQVIFNQSGSIYLTARNGTVIYSVSSSSVTASQFYQRAILEHDGVLRQYVYPKSATLAGRWPMEWSVLSFIPSNICLRITQETGGGACGFNSYCIIGSDQRPRCQCPSGYTFLDPNDEMSGCKPNFVEQNCDEELRETDRFSFVDMPNTDWPLSDYEYYQPVTEDWCRDVCLNDCFCAVAIFRDGNCWKKKNPLSNGRIDPSVGGKALVKIRKDNSTDNFSFSGPKKKDQTTLIITGIVLLGSSVFLNLVLLLSTFLVRFSNRKRNTLEPFLVMPGMNLLSFSYMELEKATNGFKEELGRGAFATVYKGVLNYEDPNVVAVKRLDRMVREGEKEFEAEVRAIGRTNHKNLVQLIGYCKEGEHRILVYEFMSNGSLATFLFENPRPSWYQRMKVAFGTARGLYYLHEECSSLIIHCDIKPQNVLLDDLFTARISDFGLAKLLKTNQTRTTTAIRGTKGYVAPEWFKNLPITAKVDVYSFGILLLEVIFCRKSLELEAACENEVILADWAYDCYKEGKLSLSFENDEEALCDMNRVEKFVMIAIWCIQEDPSLRPTMKKVTQMLEGAVEVSAPPDPSSFISSI